MFLYKTKNEENQEGSCLSRSEENIVKIDYRGIDKIEYLNRITCVQFYNWDYLSNKTYWS